jgi:hypothetical protein
MVDFKKRCLLAILMDYFDIQLLKFIKLNCYFKSAGLLA